MNAWQQPEQQSSTITLRIALLVGYCLLAVLRAPELLWPGRFWAEEAVVYYVEAYTHSPLHILLTPQLGYYSLLNKLVSLLVVYSVPLLYAPVLTSTIALLVQLLPAALLLFSRQQLCTTPWSQLVALLLLLLVQPNQEVWLNTTNSQFFLCVTTAVVLISAPGGRPAHIARLLALLLAGLTGVLSCLLLPFFAAAYLHRREQHRLHELIALSLACAIQGLMVLSDASRASNGLWNIMLFTLLVKQWISPMLGHSAANALADFIKEHQLYNQPALALATLLPYVVVGVGLARWGRRDALLLLLASLFVVSVSFLNSVDSMSVERLLTNHMSAVGSGRYYYAPNVLLALALLMPLRPTGDRPAPWAHSFRRACLVMVAALLIVGSYDFLSSRARHPANFSGPSWPSEVRSWEEGRSEALAIWPRPWTLELPRGRQSGQPGKEESTSP